MKYKDCKDRSKNLKVKVSMNAVKIVSSTPYLNCINVCSTTSWMSEKDDYEEKLFYRESAEDELEDLKLCKIGSVVLVHSSAIFTYMRNFLELKALRKVTGTRLEYADGSIGGKMSTKGNFMLNGHSIPAFVSPDLRENLLSTPRVDNSI